jgi:FlaA1/EpsC-like NDP-sugar epimerase
MNTVKPVASSRITLIAERLRQFPVGVKICIIAFFDLVLCILLVLLAHSLRVSNFVLPQASVIYLYLIAPILSIIGNAVFQVYWSATRSYSTSTEVRIVLAQLCSGILWSLIILLAGTEGFARSVVVIFFVLSALGMILLRRLMSEILKPETTRFSGNRAPVVIFGAGHEGLAVLSALKNYKRHKVVAFIDTDYTLVGRNVAGIAVYPIEQLDDVLAKYRPSELILAKGGMTRSGKRMMVDRVIDTGVTVKVIPDQIEMLTNDLAFSEIKTINVEDLLGRDPVPPVRGLMEEAIKDQVVMVTGAGGSIGSELVRQAFAYRPQKIIMVENNEFALFEIHRSIERQNKTGSTQHCELFPVLADVKQKNQIACIMLEHGVEIVFHAAAYKHVRMVQENISAGIDNNILGTKAVAEAALQSKVKRFVLISTDKAVRPTSVMGASKRVAEMVVQALAAEKGHQTIFSMVRFGNVLGSTGSVVPLFREQINKGGPVTVTHPEVTRYFMLIPEAAQLVIQAAAMAQGGEVFVLDMGEPVKIVDMAKSMIELAGLTIKDDLNPDGDIAVIFTGLTPGEKLYEELQIGTQVTQTLHPRVMRSRDNFITLKKLNSTIYQLENSELAQEHKVEKIFALASFV